MNIKRRLIFQYIRQLLFVGLLLLVVILGTFTLSVVKLERLDQQLDGIEPGLSVFTDSIIEQNGVIQFDPKLLTQVHKQGGWLQVIGKAGETIAAYNTPVDVPERYHPGELMSYWRAEADFPYVLYAWVQELDGQSYTLLYGVKNGIALLKKDLLHQVTWTGEEVELSGAFKQQLSAIQGSIQRLDENGKVLGGYGQLDGTSDQYSLQDLMLRSQYPDGYGEQLFSVYDRATGGTWVIHAPMLQPVDSLTEGNPYDKKITVFIWNAVVWLLIILIIFVLLALWYGHRFGTPILHMIDWLHHLAKGELREPEAANRQGMFFNRKWSRRFQEKFHEHTELMESLAHLTGTLQKNEHIRKQLETTREEWIAGVSHDMKTPLSSIMGYAHLMESGTYEWSQAEIREFAAIMREKSSYMDEMINDLTLTYRLKNEAFAFAFIPTDIDEFIGETVQKWRQHPRYADVPVQYTPSSVPITYPIDHRTFQRMLENLLANATLHNPEGTQIDISVLKDNDLRFEIRIQDNGVGMDEDTKALLFERYYRGTNTDESMQGTGLGMAISKQLVLQHGGQIEVQSEPGNGTTISLIFGTPG